MKLVLNLAAVFFTGGQWHEMGVCNHLHLDKREDQIYLGIVGDEASINTHCLKSDSHDERIETTLGCSCCPFDANHVTLPSFRSHRMRM